jgi:tRNA(Ile)-lysidine synthase
MARYGMVTPGDVVLVAVSGGPDSTCLLDVLMRLSTKLELSLEVAHVDHGLSPESSEVASRVAASAAEAGLDVHMVRAPDLAGPNLHARARDFRYGFFDAIAAQVGARRIATGHTLDDRVETTLARLVHGAAPEGLAGIPPIEGARIRPLISSRRPETRAYCLETALVFFDDEANDDERFERAAVRAELVAAIEKRWGEGAVRAIATSAERLREDTEALAGLADRVYTEIAVGFDEGVRLPAGTMTSVPRALRRRLLEKAVGRIRDRSGGIEAALEALDDPGGPLRRFAVAGGTEIVLEKEGDVVVRRAPLGVDQATDTRTSPTRMGNDD